MALGKNMKVERLIPIQKEEESEDKIVNGLVDVIIEKEVKKDLDVLVEVNVELEESKVPQIVTAIYEDIDTGSIKVFFKPSLRKTQKRILIDIEGALTINNVELLHSKVSAIFQYFDYVEVTMKNVTEIDLTVIQLFHAIRVFYYPQNKFIAINADFSRESRKLLNTCGFTEFNTQKVTSN